MRRYKLSYFAGQAFRSLWRNGVMSFASIAVLVSCLVVLGSFSLLVANINANIEDLGLNEIMVFLDHDLSEDEILRVEQRIRNISYVGDVRRITAAEGLEMMIEQAGDDGYLYEPYRDDNPLSDSFEITNIDPDHYTDVTYSLGLLVGEGVSHLRDQRSLANMMQSIKNGIMLVFSWFLAVLFIVSIFVIINTIKLSVYSRKSEISIMRYVGATGWFISLPFVIEGALIGLFASVIAYIMEHFIYGYIEGALVDISSVLKVIPLSDLNGVLFAGFVAVGVLTGVVGSTISLSKYTRN